MPAPTPPGRRDALRLLAAAGVGLAAPPAAPAFYFDYGPGAGLPPPRSLVPTTPDDTMNPPSARIPPGGPVPPGLVPPDNPNTPNDNPPEVPEPATGVAALVGLAAVLVRRTPRPA